MIFFHTFACMVLYHMIEETPEFLSFYQFYLTSTVTFVTVAGVALVLRHARRKGKTSKSYYISIIKKSAVLFATAMLITLFTWLFSVFALSGGTFIKFGFLHMLSLSMILSLPFLKLGRLNLPIGIAAILIGIFVMPMLEGPWWLFPLGVESEFLAGSMEFFPLLPWFGVLLLGVGIGNIFYPGGVRRFNPKPESVEKIPGFVNKAVDLLAKIGNGNVTLIVYLVHAPVIMGILQIVSLITGVGYL